MKHTALLNIKKCVRRHKTAQNRTNRNLLWMWHDSDIRFHINAETVRNTSFRQDIHRYEQIEAWKSSKFRRKYPFVYRVSQFYDISWRTLEKSTERHSHNYTVSHGSCSLTHLTSCYTRHDEHIKCVPIATLSAMVCGLSEWENEAAFAGDGCMRFACQFFGGRKHKNLCSSSYKYKSKRKRLWRYF